MLERVQTRTENQDEKSVRTPDSVRRIKKYVVNLKMSVEKKCRNVNEKVNDSYELTNVEKDL